MDTFKQLFVILIAFLGLFFPFQQGFADQPKLAQLGLTAIKVKQKGSWTEVTIAIENLGNSDATFRCCTTFLENTDGYAIASLDNSQVQTQIYNKARTPSIVGGILAGGLGLAGVISGKKELGYAGLGLGGASAIAHVVGGSSADKKHRELVIDGIMRNHVFPSGLKVAGVAYFPPKKKWPGSKKAEEIHLTYEYQGRLHRVSAPVP